MKLKTDDKGNVTGITQGDSVFKGVGTAFVDFGQTLTKAVGDLTGASGAWKKLADSGAVDAAKTQIQRLMSASGISTKNKDGRTYKYIATKKDGENADKAEAAAAQAAQLKELQKISENEKNTTQAVKDLIEELKKKK